MPKHLFVASDLSARSDRAIQRAFRLAKQHGAKVTVYSVLDDAMPLDIAEEAQKRASSNLQRFAESLSEGAVEFTVEVKMGDPFVDIVAAADASGADLLVLGTHRPRGLFDGLRETTMQRIVRNTNHPVLLVHDRVDHDYATILAACDFSPAATAAIELASKLSPDSTIRPIHALHVPYSGMLARSGGSDAEMEAPFRRDAQELDTSWREAKSMPDGVGDTEVIAGSAFTLLYDQVRTSGADLICAGAHGRIGANPAVLGSLANDLMRDPPCDLLIARP